MKGPSSDERVLTLLGVILSFIGLILVVRTWNPALSVILIGDLNNYDFIPLYFLIGLLIITKGIGQILTAARWKESRE